MNQKPRVTVLMVALGVTGSAGPFKSCLVNEQMRVLCQLGIHVVPFKIERTTSIVALFKDVIKLRRLVSESEARIIHAQYGSITALIAALASLGRANLIVSYCGSDLLEASSDKAAGRLRPKIAAVMSRLSAFFCSAIVVKSRNLYEQLPRGVRHKATILPNGVDVQRFQPLDRQATRVALGIDPDEKLVLMNKTAATSSHVKCPELAREAVNLIGADAKVKLLELCDRPYEEMPLYLNAADVLLVTSEYEGSPNIIKEAMACNLPVVSVDCGDVATRLENVNHCFVVGRNPREIANAVSRILQSSARTNGRDELLRQSLDASTVARNIIKLYQQVADAQSAQVASL